MTGITPSGDEQSRVAVPGRAFLRIRLQDSRRSLCRPTDPVSHFLRKTLSGFELLTTPTARVKERFGQLLTIQGKHQKPLESAQAGDIVAVAKLKETLTGDTLSDEKAPIKIPPASLPQAVISFASRAQGQRR